MTNRGGRPPINGKPMRRVTVYLNPDQILWAHREGNGNVSDGVRQLLDELSDARAWHRDKLAAQAVPEAPIRRQRHQ